jgi:predicted transcriptional regulator
MMAPRATVTFHTSPEVKARLERLAALTRRSKSFLTNEAVERYLAEEEAFVAAVQEGIAEAEAGILIGHDQASTYLRSVASGTLSSDEPEPRRS